MRCNQRFFGQEHFERGTREREFCSSLIALKPTMSQYGFAMRDRLPPLPADIGGLVQVKYNGMLSILMWDEEREGYVAWSPRGRIYYSLKDRGHPVIDHINEQFGGLNDVAFVGETYVEREIDGKSYMTEFNRSMSIIKNPQSRRDVDRIKLAIFDYAEINEDGEFVRPQKSYVDRFSTLGDHYSLPGGCDGHRVHLPDHLFVDGSSFEEHGAEIQGFWDEFIGKRGFEGLIMHTEEGDEYKVKYRDTIDVAIIAFRMKPLDRLSCVSCGARFDSIWLRKMARERVVARSDWFDERGRLKSNKTGTLVTGEMDKCPICGGAVQHTDGPILGAKVALMTSEGDLVDIADGAQLSTISPILDLIEPLYEYEGYLWVKPEVVIEVSYQDLYVDRPRPVYRFEGGRYVRVGTRKAVSLRPYGPRLREDKGVNPRDLRLEQVSYFVERVKRIEKRWRDTKPIP